MNLHNLTDTLIRHEGRVVTSGRHQMYKDSVGKVTIGYGRNLTDRGISENEARFLLHEDINEVIQGLGRYWWFTELDEVRQEVVINMAFNLGLTGFSKFRNTIGYISDGNYSQAAANMLKSKWARQVGIRAQELSRMMASGLREA